MASRSKPNDSHRKLRPPATTPEGRENQLVSAATDLAEKQIREGTASSQVITHYLKLGSTAHKLEMQKLEADTKLKLAQVEAQRSGQKIEELLTNAFNAMRSYSGIEPEMSDDD